MAAAERITDRLVGHGEGPCWSPTWGGLRFVDLYEGDIVTLDASGATSRKHYGDVVAITRPRVGGGAVVAVERGIVLEAPDGSLERLPELWGPRVRLRMNEGGCDPDGRFYAGNMAYDQADGKGTGRGAVFRLDVDGTTSIVVEEVTISNGLGWSPDGTLAYYNDTPTGRTDVFDYTRDGGLTNRRPFAQVNDESGRNRPDGLTVDAEGGVWTALFGVPRSAATPRTARWTPSSRSVPGRSRPAPSAARTTASCSSRRRAKASRTTTTPRPGASSASCPG